MADDSGHYPVLDLDLDLHVLQYLRASRAQRT